MASWRRAGTRRTSVGWPDMPASHLPCSHNPGKAILPPLGIPTWPRSAVTAQACCYLPNRCIHSPESLPRLIWLAVPKHRAPSPAKTTLSSFRQQFLKAFWQGSEGGRTVGSPRAVLPGWPRKATPAPHSGDAVNRTWHRNGCIVYRDALLQANLPLNTWPNSHAIN